MQGNSLTETRVQAEQTIPVKFSAGRVCCAVITSAKEHNREL
jgi:hypothetical protein